MSLWGNKELVSSTGTVGIAITNGLVTGDSTTFVTDGVAEGDVIVVGTGATTGYGVVKSVASNTSLTLHSVQYLRDPSLDERKTRTTNVPTETDFYIGQIPVSVLSNPALTAPEAKSNRTDVIYGVDAGEQTTVNAASGDARKYAAPHAGWVGVTTYIQTNADGTTELRVKSEVLVAGGADADGNGGISASADREDVTYTG